MNQPAKRRTRLEIMPAILEALCELIKTGMPITAACARAGVARRTFYAWYSAGASEDASPVEASFREAIDRARAEKIEGLLAEIREAARTPNAKTGQRDVRALMWLLERTEPALFGARISPDIIDLHEATDAPTAREELEGMVARIRARTKATVQITTWSECVASVDRPEAGVEYELYSIETIGTVRLREICRDVLPVRARSRTAIRSSESHASIRCAGPGPIARARAGSRRAPT